MASFNGTFYSKELCRPVHFTAVLSNDNAARKDDDPMYKRDTKNIYLLHGYSGTDSDWPSNAPLGEIANRYNVNFFMPAGENSFYLDRPETGAKYAQYVGKEFVEYTRKTFNLSEKRENTYIGGLSMGGFGALHTAFMFNETFSKTIALSSALIADGIKYMRPEDDNPVANYEYYRTVFGDPSLLDSSDNNPKVLVKRLADEGKIIPEIYMACGTEDFLIEPNNDFKSYLDGLNVPVTYFTGPGIHDFVFWRAQLEAGIKWALNI